MQKFKIYLGIRFNMNLYLQAYTRLIKCSLMLGDVMEAENGVNKLEQLEPSKQSIASELNDLAHLKRFIKEAEIAYNIKDYRKVNFFNFIQLYFLLEMKI